MRRLAWATVLLGACGGGSNGGESGPVTSNSKIIDAENCKDCHPRHFAQWQGSMHAQAANDPVFLAMNERGQRETDGELGGFCVGCHAPMAVQLGLTDDGLNLSDLPQRVKGVTCYFCHNTTDVTGTHNNPLTLGLDRIMRGPIQDPFDGGFHGAEYADEQDGLTLRSGDMCGSCHDIVTPNGVHLERTYEEWKFSFFSNPDAMNPALPDMMFFGQTCNNCHMAGTYGSAVADVEGVPADRVYHDHRFVGVDVALVPFPDEDQAPALEADQRAGIDEVRRTVLCASLCVRDEVGGDGKEVVAWLHNEFAGHHWPSGANQDRRAWAEVIAYDAADQVLFQTGVVPDGTPVVDVESTDPNFWSFRDRIVNDAGEEVHMFWDATDTIPSNLSVAEEFFGDSRTWEKRVFPAVAEGPDRVTLRVQLRAMGLEVIDSLITSGDLDPALRDRFETFNIPPAELTWIPPDPANEDSAQLSDTYGSCVHSGQVCFSPFSNCSGLGQDDCGTEPVCTWTEPELDSQSGWCWGCQVWTDETSCDTAEFCLWDGASCNFNKCMDVPSGLSFKCIEMTDCGWGDACAPCSIQTETDCPTYSGCAWDGAVCTSCSGQDEAACGMLPGCGWEPDVCGPAG